MPPKSDPRRDPATAGLRKLAELVQQDGPAFAAAADATSEPDILGVTDGIAIERLERPAAEEDTTFDRRLSDFLKKGWQLRDDSGGKRTSLVLLPPLEDVPSIARGWEVAREIAAWNDAGVACADLLVAQVTPDAFPSEDEAGPPAVAAAAAAEGPPPGWHIDLLKVREAWQLFADPVNGPGAGVKIAVLDTGYTKHPEILSRLTTKAGRPGKVFGLDLIDGDDPLDPVEGFFPFATPSHGTGVMSVIASPEGEAPATACAPVGVTGLAPGARILPVRMTTHVALLGPNLLVPAMKKAVEEGADVFNIALGAPIGWPNLQRTLQAAVAQGVIVVAAAGNYWPRVVYPAAYVEAVAAAACDINLQPWNHSARGSAVDITAPGVNVHRATTRRDGNNFEFCTGPSTGTTFATACCVALAALWLSHHGGRQKLIEHYKPDAKRVPQAFHYLLRKTAQRPLGFPLNGDYGAGLPNALDLLNAPLPTPAQLDMAVEVRELELATIDQADVAYFADFSGIPAAERAVDQGWRAMETLLGLRRDDPRFDALASEVQFQITSRPTLVAKLERLLATGLAGDLRQALLRGSQLSRELRDTLEQAQGATAEQAALPDMAAPGAPGAQEMPAIQAEARLRPYASEPTAAPLSPSIRRPPPPTERRLQVFAFDPSLSGQLRTIDYNRITLAVPWESLKAGPMGEYLEVVDVDPASRSVYAPVDLDDPHLLGSNGLAPNEGDPQFHQQMVYAVAMRTIRQFERALGRPAFWATAPYWDKTLKRLQPEPFQRRLRIFPHALRKPNAYYSPTRRALLFGYFPAPLGPGEKTAAMVFTCLSYDVIAHETTHALLDGMYRNYMLPTNPDVRAFHEAFADLVALLQYFTHPEILLNTIHETRGDLEADSLLGKLARQFGRARGHPNALRDAIGVVDKDGVWRRRVPDPRLLQSAEYAEKPHLRGTVLVAAVFDAFLSIYKRRTRPLIRLATGGSGVLPPGAISADLATALSYEAAKSADHTLSICIRALDYLPPIDVTFGEYLRALITADRDLVPNDSMGYRVAFAEAFRSWGIHPEGVSSFAPDSLSWEAPEGEARDILFPIDEIDKLNRTLSAWRMNGDRKSLHVTTVSAKAAFNLYLRRLDCKMLRDAIGIDNERPFEVHTLRPASSIGPNDEVNGLVVVTLTQKRDGSASAEDGNRSGSTIIFNLADRRIRYVVRKRGESRQEMRAGALQPLSLEHSRDDAYGLLQISGEPFASLHEVGRLV